MGEAEIEPMTVEEFFNWQAKQDRNYELVDGVPVLAVKAMTGATRRHDYVTVNAIASLHQHLKGKPCRPSTSDQSIRTNRGTRRPDVLVECGPFDESSMAASEPRLVIEVLSPSTMRVDRFQKLEEYKAVDAIQVILIVDSVIPQVAVWRRDGTDWTTSDIDGLEAIIDLPEIGIELPMAELYEGLEFEEPYKPID